MGVAKNGTKYVQGDATAFGNFKSFQTTCQ
jgi:hypothetical protein